MRRLVPFLVALLANVPASADEDTDWGAGVVRVEGAADPSLPASTRPWIVEITGGPSMPLAVCQGQGERCDGAAVFQGLLSQVIGAHVTGDGEGFALGVGVQEAFGSSLVRVQPGLRFWGDFALAPGQGLYMSPQAQIGYARYQAVGGDGSDMFNWQLVAAIRLVLGDRITLTIAPAGFDWATDGESLFMWFDASMGFGVTF